MIKGSANTRYTSRVFQRYYSQPDAEEKSESKADNNANNKRPNKNNRNIKPKENVIVSNEIDNNEEESKRMQRVMRFSAKHKTEHTLLSRGGGEELRLNRHNERETFFIQIKRNFLEYCSNSETDLKTDLSRLSNKKAAKYEKKNRSKIDAILLDLRKLREALLSSKPTEFTIRVYLYSIKVGVMSLHHQTYMHCIDYLITNIVENKNCQVKLTDIELEEISSVYILHLAHFNLTIRNLHNITNASNLLKCYELYLEYIPKSFAIKDILRSVVDNNYLLWFQSYKVLRANIMYKIILEKYGLKPIVSDMVQTLNSAYYKLSKIYLEDTILSQCITFEYLHNNFDQCKSWKLSEGQITIRNRSSKEYSHNISRQT